MTTLEDLHRLVKTIRHENIVALMKEQTTSQFFGDNK